MDLKPGDRVERTGMSGTTIGTIRMSRYGHLIFVADDYDWGWLHVVTGPAKWKKI